MYKDAAVQICTLTAMLDGVVRKKCDIVRDVCEEYIDPTYEGLMRELESKVNSAEKHVQWSVWKLERDGFLRKTERGWYQITQLGKDFLRTIPYHLTWLEREFDKEGVVSGKTLHELRKLDDGTYGAAIEAAKMRRMLENIETAA